MKDQTSFKWVCSKEGEIQRVSYEFGEAYIGRVLATLTNRTRHNRKHARLICAAPDLLAVCKSLVAWCDKNQPAGQALYFVQQARAVIAQVEGDTA